MAYPVQIGIVTYNSRHDIEPCLAAVFQQTYPAIRVSIVDNASSDDTVSWLQQHYSVHGGRVTDPPLRLILNSENVGFGRAHNQMMATIGNAHYLALNPDAILAPDYVEQLVTALETYQAGWLTGKLLLPNGQHLYSAGHAMLSNGFAFNIGYGMLDTPEFNQARQVFGASGAAVLYSADLIADLGQPFFDEAFFLYGEDTDIDWRSQHRGWDCWYIPTATAIHCGSQASQELQAQAVANRYLSLLKNACLLTLMTQHIALMFLHLLFRLFFTPLQGWWMLRQIIGYAPQQWRKRRIIRHDCKRIREWHRWSSQQPSGQPHKFIQRLRGFMLKQMNVKT